MDIFALKQNTSVNAHKMKSLNSMASLGDLLLTSPKAISTIRGTPSTQTEFEQNESITQCSSISGPSSNSQVSSVYLPRCSTRSQTAFEELMSKTLKKLDVPNKFVAWENSEKISKENKKICEIVPEILPDQNVLQKNWTRTKLENFEFRLQNIENMIQALTVNINSLVQAVNSIKVIETANHEETINFVDQKGMEVQENVSNMIKSQTRSGELIDEKFQCLLSQMTLKMNNLEKEQSSLKTMFSEINNNATYEFESMKNLINIEKEVDIFENEEQVFTSVRNDVRDQQQGCISEYDPFYEDDCGCTNMIQHAIHQELHNQGSIGYQTRTPKKESENDHPDIEHLTKRVQPHRYAKRNRIVNELV